MELLIGRARSYSHRADLYIVSDHSLIRLRPTPAAGGVAVVVGDAPLHAQLLVEMF
jgi:hypothetical protein